MTHEQTIAGRKETAPDLVPGLYVVATPIGNLRDITLRALDTLAAADHVLCEDTRLTGRLLTHFSIRRPLLPYHEHNAQQMRPRVLALLAEGKALALVSDAGTPLISDPGYKLVRAAAEAGIATFAIPGPSAITAALSVGGLPTDRFLFVGFLPVKPVARREAIAELAPVSATLVILESPQRIQETLRDLSDILGDRPAAIARELTKIYEEVRRGTLQMLSDALAHEPVPKGEIVLLVAPGEGKPHAARRESVEADLGAALQSGLALKDAAAAVAALHGLTRREVYARALALKQGSP